MYVCIYTYIYIFFSFSTVSSTFIYGKDLKGLSGSYLKHDKDLMGLKGSLEVLVYRNGPKGLPRSFRNSRLSQGLRPCCEWWRTFRPWNRNPQARRVHWNTSITTLKLERTWRNHRGTEVRVSRIVVAAPDPRL